MHGFPNFCLFYGVHHEKIKLHADIIDKYCTFQVIELGCVDNCRVVLNHVEDFKFTDDQVLYIQ